MQCLKRIVCSYFVCCGKQRGKIKVYENYSREEGVPFRQHTHTIAVKYKSHDDGRSHFRSHQSLVEEKRKIVREGEEELLRGDGEIWWRRVSHGP